MRGLFLALLPLSALPASAESLSDLRSTLTRREIEVQGHIGTGLNIMDPEALAFRDAQKNTYPVIFDAGRTARKHLEGCEFKMFGGTPCAMTGKAEIDLDGATLRLIIYDIADIAAPAKLAD